MFRCFPTPCVWGRSADLSLETAARIGEMQSVCTRLQEAAKQAHAPGTPALREIWQRAADKLRGLAEAYRHAVILVPTPARLLRRTASCVVRRA